jgi:hypothetical protein
MRSNRIAGAAAGPLDAPKAWFADHSPAAGVSAAAGNFFVANCH